MAAEGEPVGRMARLRVRAGEAWAAMAPGPVAWRGAAWGLALGTAATFVLKLSSMVFDRWGLLWWLLYVLPTALVPALLACLGVLLLARLLAALPLGFRVVLLVSVGLLYVKIWTGTPTERLVGTLYVLVSTGLAGAGLAAVLRWRRERTTRLRQGIAFLAMATGLAAVAYGARWLRGDGAPNAPVIDAAQATRVEVPQLDLPDPSARGPFAVRFLTYGSGNDRLRPEYAKGAALITKPIDAATFLDGWHGGFESWARTRYWGFGPHAVPINARVFYPDAPGPRPVVVIAHGAHPMEDFSEPGYDYLGEHLASHGFVFVSVDENFLNTGGLGSAVTSENPARGYLLLKHLEALRGFHTAEGGPLSGKLDLDRVALMGHSRGGEAITIAAQFNRLSHFPDDATIRFDFRFGIKALVAICTSDKQYQPGGMGIALEDISYLALGSSNDSDARHFAGTQQFDRVRFTKESDDFKAAVYVHRANHGQYNRVWGRHDQPWFPLSVYANRKPIMPAADQERIARTYITAFLQATLEGQRGYRALFQDHRAGRRWLPETIYINRYVGATTRMIASYDEDVDVTTTTAAGGRIEGQNLTVWRESPVGAAALTGSTDTRGVTLGWDADATAGTPSYVVKLPPSGVEADAGGALVFALADANLNPNPRGRLRAGFAGRTHPPYNREPRAPIDLDVELADAQGHVARIPLARVALLQPQLTTRVWKGWFNRPKDAEPVLGTYALPFSLFTSLEPRLDVAHLAEIRFVFDRSPAGVVVLKDVGFRGSR